MNSTEHVLLALLLVLGVIWIGGGIVVVIADHLDARLTAARKARLQDGNHS